MRATNVRGSNVLASRVLPLFLVLFAFPSQVRFSNHKPIPRPGISGAAALREIPALSYYRQLVTARGEKMDDQGILVQTLNGANTLAQQNPDVPFNPASVMKLATSLVALSKLGPDYRFRTDFLADGSVEPGTHILQGDLVVAGRGDPMFSATDVDQVARDLASAGVSRVKGQLRISGAFVYFAEGYHDVLSPQTSAAKLYTGLRRAGIQIEKGVGFGTKSGALLLSHYSDQLFRILLFQNAHSSNPIAEAIGADLGGPTAIQGFLMRNLGLKDGEVFVGRCSGLDFNRITPRAALTVLRNLVALLDKYSAHPQDIMAIAGVDSGTLRTRFQEAGVQGAIVAKTGTLNSLDGGVSTLVGIAYTASAGPVLFGIFDSDGSVRGYRELQDRFIEEVVAEEGGGVPISTPGDRLADFSANTIVQNQFHPTLALSR